MRQQVYFDFPADVKHVLDVREASHRVCLDMGFKPHDASLIITAIWEATLNAATHGSPGGRSDQVQVNILAEDDVLKVDVTSQNRAFSLPDSKPLLIPTSKRGRGLPIIFAFMDDVWLTEDERGVTLHMMKRLTDDKTDKTEANNIDINSDILV